MRYTIHKIRQADCSEIDAAVLGEAATAEDARKLATSIAHKHYYGVATRDNEAGTIDFGNEVRSVADVEVTERPRQTYHWRTDAAHGDIEAVSAEEVLAQLIRNNEWPEDDARALRDGAWLRISSAEADDSVSRGIAP